MIMAKLPNFLRLTCRDGRALPGIFILLVLLVGSSGCASHHPAKLQLQPPSHVSPLRDAEGAPNLRLLSYNIWGLPGCAIHDPRRSASSTANFVSNQFDL
jgi:hypothetical protein